MAKKVCEDIADLLLNDGSGKTYTIKYVELPKTVEENNFFVFQYIIFFLICQDISLFCGKK